MEQVELFKVAGTIAGLAGIVLIVFFLLFKEIIRKNIFPKMTKRQAYRVVIIILFLIWSLAIFVISAWVYKSKMIQNNLSMNEVPLIQETSDLDILNQYKGNVDVPNMIKIEEGKYLIGLSEESVANLVAEKIGNREDFSNETPQIKYSIKGYFISKYEISVKQYRQFAVQKNKQLPENLKDNNFNADDQPIMGVSWYDAREYCDWLSNKTGEKYRLPTEIEWEIAAKGTDNRIFPDGNNRPNTNNCNFYEQFNKTSPVDKTPMNFSYFKVVNMAGNIAEWCDNNFEENYYQKLHQNIDYLSSGDKKCIRGGSWKDNIFFVRCTARVGLLPDTKKETVGFRIVKILNQ
ncbi:MAG: SUMF1/EgtB/PvdO family nonheme iron enzyme [Bacteroidales bacterium]|jgi:formylglycine-generating enzyme required for sulfatase activity